MCPLPLFIDSTHPKPCLHPVTTPGGLRLSGYRMSDHPWHRALWFTFKYINGHNYWEENVEDTGVQTIQSQETEKDGTLKLTLLWSSQTTGDVMLETRKLQPLPKLDGVEIYAWSSHLEILQDIELDRTPFTTWGGYGGLSFRANREMHEASFHHPNGQTDSCKGDRHPWLGLEGRFDGGENLWGGIAIFDHPENPRYPTPFYAKTGGGFTFMNAAILFDESMKLERGQQLELRYHIAICDGRWDKGQLANIAEQLEGVSV